MTNKTFDCGLSTTLIYNVEFHKQISKLPPKKMILNLKKYYLHVLARHYKGFTIEVDHDQLTFLVALSHSFHCHIPTYSIH
jgi:hypothetical protein